MARIAALIEVPQAFYVLPHQWVLQRMNLVDLIAYSPNLDLINIAPLDQLEHQGS
jgi:hypothetical protein